MSVRDMPKRDVHTAARIKQAAAIKECLHYLLRDALASDLPLTAQMIGVSAEAVLMDLEKMREPHEPAAQ